MTFQKIGKILTVVLLAAVMLVQTGAPALAGKKQAALCLWKTA